MFRGTTPTLSVKLDDIKTSLIDYVELTINQNEKNMLVKKMKQNGSEFSVTLTERETLSLKPGDCRIQCKIKLKDGSITATKVEKILINDILNQDVML